MAYFDDEGGQWGEDIAREELYDEIPELRDDAEFQHLFDEIFSEGMNWDEAHEAYDNLHDYLADEYDIDIDPYWDWEDWRVEHMDS